MKGLLGALVALLIATATSPAAAYVVVVTTSVAVAEAVDEAQLKTTVESAVRDVLAHAIAFTPTVVTLETARVVGDRIYLVLLIADADGEKSIEALSALPLAPDDSAAASPRFTF